MLDARISLGDALGGGPAVEVARPDGSTFRVKLAREGDVLKHGALRCVEGEGMPVRGAPGKRGRLFLRVVVEFPDALDLDPERRRELERILGLPPSSPSARSSSGGDRVARQAARRHRGRAAVAARRAAPVSRLGARTFAVDEKIPKDIDQQTGRRMAEIKYELETGVRPAPPGRRAPAGPPQRMFL